MTQTKAPIVVLIFFKNIYNNLCLLFLKSLKLIKKLCKFELGILSKLHSTKIAHYKLQTKVLYIVFSLFLMNSFHHKTIAQELKTQILSLPVDSKTDTTQLHIVSDSILPKKKPKKNNQKLEDIDYRDRKRDVGKKKR